MTGSTVRVYADNEEVGEISDLPQGFQAWSQEGEPLGPPQVTFVRALKQLNASEDAHLRWDALRACAACGGDGWLASMSEPSHPHYNHGDTTCPFCKGTGKEVVPAAQQ